MNTVSSRRDAQFVTQPGRHLRAMFNRLKIIILYNQAYDRTLTPYKEAPALNVSLKARAARVV